VKNAKRSALILKMLLGFVNISHSMDRAPLFDIKTLFTATAA
jgi:hypothetical protein